MSMCYFDFPQEKIDLFEPSQKNYYFESGSKYSYLCSQAEISTVNFMRLSEIAELLGKNGYTVLSSGNDSMAELLIQW